MHMLVSALLVALAIRESYQQGEPNNTSELKVSSSSFMGGCIASHTHNLTDYLLIMSALIISHTTMQCDEGECVPYYLCENGTIITDGKGMLDLRFGEDDNPDPKKHPCKGLFQTCCTVRAKDPILTRFERKQGCGQRNTNGVGFEITPTDNETQFGMIVWLD